MQAVVPFRPRHLGTGADSPGSWPGSDANITEHVCAPAPRWKAALIILQLRGSAPPSWCITGCWHLYAVRAGLPKLASEVGWCVRHCWALPAGSLSVCWEKSTGGGAGQEEELLSQSLFGLRLAVLWDGTLRGRGAWCLSAFSSHPVLKEVHFQNALMPVRAFYVTCDSLSNLLLFSFAFFSNYPVLCGHPIPGSVWGQSLCGTSSSGRCPCPW